MFASWKQFAELAGEVPGSARTMADRLQQRGFERLDHVPLVGGRGYRGLRVKDA
ncbi:hypothetical protein D3C83_252660 [compost metagenome]